MIYVYWIWFIGFMIFLIYTRKHTLEIILNNKKLNIMSTLLLDLLFKSLWPIILLLILCKIITYETTVTYEDKD